MAGPAPPDKIKADARPARPLVLRQDILFVLELPVLLGAAALLPTRRWAGFARRLERLKHRLGMFSTVAVRRGRATLSSSEISGPEDPQTFAIASAAGRSEHHLQVLASLLPGGWNEPVRLEGAGHLDAALAEGHGAVLWIAHFCFNALATKKALAGAGYRCWHLSRPEHGFSKSRLGIRLFNPMRVRAELPHLSGRIVVDRDHPGRATLTARRVLAGNGIVSITAGAWEGRRLVTLPMVGGQLRLAAGAPVLARLSGAPLLPVFTVRGAPGSPIRVVVETPIDGTDAAAAARAFGARHEPWLRRHAVEWRDWKNFEPS